ncbi:MAG: hypothetical protein CBB69_002875 [Phycisphaera sp. TMED9]|nr:MAG: hypothetical protein CBB69_002875 [Phycisphaera sp. TMED9]
MKNMTLAGAAVLCLAGAAVADVYQIDNDEALTNIGVPGGPITWGNAFETTDTMLENIAFGLGINQGGTMVGSEMAWEVFGSQQNNPSFLTSLGGGLHTIENDQYWENGNLDVIDVNIDLSGYSWFFIVGSYNDTTGTTFAAAQASNVTFQSWAAVAPNPIDIAGGALIDDFGLPGTWVIRGNVPAPGAICLLGLAGLAGRRRRG